MEVIDTAYSGCMKDLNTVVVAFVVVVVDVAIVKDNDVKDAVVEDADVDLKITKITIKLMSIVNLRCL